jgi:DNA replication protein DnaC
MIPDTMAYKRTLLGYCMGMHLYEPDGHGWILYGKLGSGKTTLGALILKYCLAKGGRVITFRATDMLDRLMSYKEQVAPNGAPLLTALTNVTYLMVDDLQEEDGNRLRKLETVLRARYDDQFPTVITTNMPKERVFDIPWLRDIIEDRYHGEEIIGIDWRKRPPAGRATSSLL